MIDIFVSCQPMAESLTVEGGTEKCSSYFRWKSDEHPKSVRSCDEAGDFHDVTLAWNDDEF